MSKEAMQQALDAIEGSGHKADLMAAADALRAALAEQAQPVACDLPDEIRVPLHRLWADAAYLIGRAKSGETDLAVQTIKALCDEVERAVRHALYTTPPAPVVPPGWRPISEPYEQADELDIMLSDGSILCAVLPQFDGDLWWGGDGTGEKFIDPKYANIKHWRLHAAAPEAPTPPVPKPLTDEQKQIIHNETGASHSLICLVEIYIRDMGVQK